MTIVLALASVGCGPEPTTKAGDTNAGTASASNNGATNNGTAGAPTTVDQGLYIGEPEVGTADQVTLSVWPVAESYSGHVVVDGVRAFRLDLTDTPRLSALDGACFDCPTVVWDVDVRATTDGLRLDVLADDDGPGFAGVNMVPHDGFKPENAPAPGAVVWAGAMVAVAPEATDHPVLDSDCEVYVDPEQLVSVTCRAATAESPWEQAVGSSWTSEDDQRSWIVESGDLRVGFVGTVTGSNPVQLHGTIVRLDGGEEPTDSRDTIGTFRLTQ